MKDRYSIIEVTKKLGYLKIWDSHKLIFVKDDDGNDIHTFILPTSAMVDQVIAQVDEVSGDMLTTISILDEMCTQREIEFKRICGLLNRNYEDELAYKKDVTKYLDGN